MLTAEHSKSNLILLLLGALRRTLDAELGGFGTCVEAAKAEEEFEHAVLHRLQQLGQCWA